MGLLSMAFRRVRKLAAWAIAVAMVVIGAAGVVFILVELGVV